MADTDLEKALLIEAVIEVLKCEECNGLGYIEIKKFITSPNVNIIGLSHEGRLCKQKEIETGLYDIQRRSCICGGSGLRYNTSPDKIGKAVIGIDKKFNELIG